MARSYLFFQPSRLPLASHELAADTTLNIDTAAARTALSQAYPGMEWADEEEGRVVDGGRWLEFRLPTGDLTLRLRCSLRADHGDIVQGLCDRFGWLAFDEKPQCYQPHRPPMPA